MVSSGNQKPPLMQVKKKQTKKTEVAVVARKIHAEQRPQQNHFANQCAVKKGDSGLMLP